MITQQELFLELLGKRGVQFVIPVFQRVYSWNTEQCGELWLDVMRSGRTKNVHFIGTLLYSKEPVRTEGIERFAIIDGQQRTTTLTLLLAAFEKHLRTTGKKVGFVDADFIRNNYLMVGPEHKLVLSRTDRHTLFALMDGTDMPERVSERVVTNFQYFLNRMCEEGFDAERLWEGMQHLLLISANLAGEDRPQLIFESLNARGTPLTTGDMVRNYLLISESREEQERLYEEYWKPIETMFGDDPESAKLNAGIRAWLTVRFVKVHIHNKGETYSVFKTYVEDEYEGPIEDLLIELRDFCLMWSENYKSHDVMTGSKEFRSWDWAKGKRTTLVPPRFSQGGF
ncbi:MAG: DUF262 domain-containing protein [Coriobacteriia bacterium]|nr:DUF262 domain-containing protein [Coriobacteriia bacterium]